MNRRAPKSEVSLCVKYTLFFFNFVIWLASLVIVGIGSYGVHEKDKYSYTGGSDDDDGGFDIYDLLFDATIIILVIGLVLFIISFAGCIGALRENTILLNVFALVVGIVFLAEVTIAILGFAFKDSIANEVEKVLREDGIEKYRDDPDWHDLVNWFQEEFECCGFSNEGYRDWNNNIYFHCDDGNRSPEACGVPYSCCIRPDDINNGIINTMCGYGVQEDDEATASSVIHTEGCIRAASFTEDTVYAVGGTILAIAVAQLLCICFARVLTGQIQTTKAIAKRY